LHKLTNVKQNYRSCYIADISIIIVYRFRVVTYNLLADLYTDSDYSRDILYPYCPHYALDIEYRKQLIVKELLGKYLRKLTYIISKIKIYRDEFILFVFQLCKISIVFTFRKYYKYAHFGYLASIY